MINLVEAADRLIRTYDKNRETDICLYPDGYVEPGYPDGPVVIANWNEHPKLEAALDRLGIEMDWSDEYVECDNCYRLFRTSPDSHGWRMYGDIFDGYAVCAECMRKDILGYLREYANEPERAVTWADSSDLEELGCTNVFADDVESVRVGWGFYGPLHSIAPSAALRLQNESDPTGEFVILEDSNGQFDMYWSMWKLPEA